MPLIDFKVVKEGLGECDCLLIVQALVRKRLYTSIGKIPLAIREYCKALRYKPDFLESLYNLAICYEHIRSYSKAAKIWERYIAIEKDVVWRDEATNRLKACKGGNRATD